jgi:hypothetical protein
MDHSRVLQALASIPPTIQRIASSMVSQKRKYVSCASILMELAQISFTKSRVVAIPISGEFVRLKSGLWH